MQFPNAVKKAFVWSAGAGALILAGAALALWIEPPDLIRVAANYAAKIVCSNVFLAGRDADQVLREDVQAPGNPLLRWMRVSVDRRSGSVRAALFGFIGGGLAVNRPGVGCAAIPDGKAPAGADSTRASSVQPDAVLARPEPALERIIADDRLAGEGFRAILVMHAGSIAAERYARGFDARTPLLGWSLTKSVMAGLIGILVKDGRLALDGPAGWSGLGADPRRRIKISDLLAMSSGLRFNESYGDVSDVTRMLFLEPDMAAFASAQPLEHAVGTNWSYSSGTAVILSRIFQDAVGEDAIRFVRERLFEPLGMTSATIETDEHGTLVGSSYMYASARDWARYGQLLLQNGIWQGQQILAPGFVTMMATPVPSSGGQYGRGQLWLWGSDALTPGKNPDAAFGIAPDTFWMEGHDGQYVAVVPSCAAVIVRLGLTPSRIHYQPQPLVAAALNALGCTHATRLARSSSYVQGTDRR